MARVDSPCSIFFALSSLSERSQQASTHANLPVELVQEKKVYLCIYLFIFPQTEQDHVQMKVLEIKREKRSNDKNELVPCSDLWGNKFLVLNTRKRLNTKSKYN